MIFHRVIAVDVDTTWITRSREKQACLAHWLLSCVDTWSIANGMAKRLGDG